MKLPIDEEFRNICKSILDEYAELGNSMLVWSDDRYQSEHFCGGWDPEHNKFYFSYDAPDGGDYIFSFTLSEAEHVAWGGTIHPELQYWKQAPDW